jgi:hypothetical protein
VTNGPHLYPSCTNCRAILADVWLTNPDDPEVWNVKAENCPFCDENPRTRGLGGSDPVTFRGGFYLGGYERTKEEDPEDGHPSTVVESSEPDGDLVRLRIARGAPGSRPYYHV